MRTASVERNTNETKITVSVNLDGSGVYDISTGLGFLDHMLEQLSKHSLIDMSVKTDGDLHIDGHHTTEDTGIALGLALKDALGERRGIARFGDCLLPMDETMTRTAVDVSGRPFLVWRVDFRRDKVGEMDTELFQEFFRALAFGAGITLHVDNLYGENNHHIVESAFKATAYALRRAIEIDPRKADQIPSTKGTITG